MKGVVVTLLSIVLVALGIQETVGFPGQAFVFEVTVEVTNTAPEGGVCLSPVWIGLHNGTFDVYNRNFAASPFLESLAEDGSVAEIKEAFLPVPGAVDGVIMGPSEGGYLCPGESASVSMVLNYVRRVNYYLSYAAQVAPSNDAFVANVGPFDHRIFNIRRKFEFDAFEVEGDDVMDAGTEANDEVPANTALLGQTSPGTGDDGEGFVTFHPGFAEDGNILSSPDFSNANFKDDDYSIMSVTASATRFRPRRKFKLGGNNVIGQDGRRGVQTDARGDAFFRFFSLNSRLFFSIATRNYEGDFRACSLHRGGRRENGPVILELFSEEDRTPGSNVVRKFINQGTLADNLRNEELWKLIFNKEVYISCTSDAFPEGELRGNF